MNYSKISREDIRKMPIGIVQVFSLPDAKSVESARVQFSTMKKLEGMDFERVACIDPLTIAYKRLK